MNDLDYTLLNALKCMSRESNESDKEYDELIEINKDSKDSDILDYVLLFLCQHSERIKNFYKGGYVLMNLLPDKARYSYDIDFSISSDKQYEEIKKIFRQLGEDLKTKGVIESYEIKDTITPTSSGGIKLKRHDKDNLGIDVGWHDVSYGMENWRFHNYDLMRFSVERMLSDKLSAIYSPKRFRRTKDLYDVYILYQSFDIDYKKLNEYIIRRNTIDWVKDPFREDVLVQYAYAYDKLRITNANNKDIRKPEFNMCISALKTIVMNLNEVMNNE